MNAGRMNLAVLTDLSASMFVACFMILLIFLSLVQNRTAPARSPQPVEAGEAFHLVRRPVLSSASMIEHLYAHRHASSGEAIDLFETGIVISSAGPADPVPFPAGGIAAGLAGLRGPVRLYVFSHEVYAETTAALGRAGVAWAEMSVPNALRDRLRPEAAWSTGFDALEASTSDPRRFRAGLALLLQAEENTPDGLRGKGNDGDGAAGSTAGASQPGSQPVQGLVERIRRVLALVAAVLAPLLAAFAVWVIERRRFRIWKLAARDEPQT